MRADMSHHLFDLVDVREVALDVAHLLGMMLQRDRGFDIELGLTCFLPL